ncbi:MAG: HisS family protein, partial [Candidatus Woesearchaeota archaeon]
REFYQFGVELFGSSNPEADAEVISLAIDSLVALGLTKDDFIVKINNRKLLEGFLESIEARDIEAITRAIDKSRKISEQDFEKELDAANASKEQIKKIKEFLKMKEISKLKDLNERAKEGVKEIDQTLNLLDVMKKRAFVEFDPSIARGLTYYTGIVFECFDKKELLRSIFAGGRYDNLIGLFGGQPTGATGFAMGDATLQLLLKSKGKWPSAKEEREYVVVPVNEDVYEDALQITQQLRKKSSTIIDINKRNLKNQLDYANYVGAKKAIIFGKQELDKGMVKVKDLKTGKEEFLKIKDLLVL